MRKFFVSAIAAMALVACTENDNGIPTVNSSTPVYQNLQVEYNDTQKQTTVSANFLKANASGENVALSGTSSITFNGQQSAFSSDAPYLYTYSFPQTENVTFALTRNSDEVYTNTVTLDGSEFPGIVNSFNTVSLQSGTTFVWFGKAIGDGETIEVRIKTASNEYKFQNSETGNIGIDIKLPATATAGKAQFTVSRIQNDELQQDDKGGGGTITVIYSNEKEITLE